MTGMLGADTAALLGLSSVFVSSAERITALSDGTSARAACMQWFGSDADRFRTTAATLQSASTLIAEALRLASQALETQARQQDETSAASGSAPQCTAGQPRGTASTFPVGATPLGVRRWWRQLTPAQRQELIASNPQLVGNTDGIPVAARDKANRILLQQQKTQLQAELVLMTDRLGFIGRTPLAKLFGDPAGIAKKIDGIEAIERVLNSPGEHYVMKIDSSDDGKFAVAYGNPETATHTGVYVPGMSSDIAGADGILDATGNLHDAMTRQALPGQAVAMVGWLGYDAPDFGPQVLSRSYAEQAAVPLDNFIDGIRANQSDPAQQISAMGHSYGSTTVGYADRSADLDIDRFIAFGSVGTTANHASEFSFGAQNTWSTTARNDIALNSPSPQEQVRLGAGIVAGVSGNYTVGGWLIGSALDPNDPHLMHGRNPSHPSFGANVIPLQSADGNTSGYQPALPWIAHTMYTRRGEPTLDAIASIATGQRDK